MEEVFVLYTFFLFMFTFNELQFYKLKAILISLLFINNYQYKVKFFLIIFNKE